MPENPYADPTRECDIIMKGGVTSGVVYPQAILKLAEQYRFRSIGGTSAGAIAAGLTAACEFNRAGGGFETIEKIPAFLAGNLLSLFQPAPELGHLFDLLFKLKDKSSLWGGLSLIAGSQIAGFFRGRGLKKTLTRTLPAHHFGMCPGPTQEGADGPGLTDWLAEQLEIAAGRMTPGGAFPDRPLVFGDLWRGALCDIESDGAELDAMPAAQRRIGLSMVTTNLSMKRPNALPFLDDFNFYFSRSDFEKLFPPFVVDYMAGAVDAAHPYGDDYFHFPLGAKMPVIVAIRMSLSFPLLFTAIPLYRRYFSDRTADDNELELTLFSDGGLTSNFPIHFFDGLLPGRPTFGISLDEYDPRKWPKDDNGAIDDRVFLPMPAREGQSLAIQKIESLFGFLMSLFNASKDWQDQLQGVLPGYRERIAHIALKPDEGGLNLDMPPAAVERLSRFGEKAGERFTGAPGAPREERFDFDEHRWRRALVLYARLEESLAGLAGVWDKDVDGENFKSFLTRYKTNPGSYAGLSNNDRDALIERLDALAELGKSWSEDSIYKPDKFPKPPTDLRITPKQ
ncbi:patatin-like phospholipase family protein [Hyphococcus luteus]|uniref:RpoH suppressor n=1 Tax=Hyphococcus luteus TaxID=2058213 RepID=A0A2S7K9U2_9PROT|nr:patatin-like phospholipase family protein [Marinicaulis flavus]PQA89251.1 RpoH suppressor [Marinicaulis flavus]